MHLGKGADLRYCPAMRRPDDTPRDTPLKRALLAIEAVVIAGLTTAALVAPIVTWLRS